MQAVTEQLSGEMMFPDESLKLASLQGTISGAWLLGIQQLEWV